MPGLTRRVAVWIFAVTATTVGCVGVVGDPEGAGAGGDGPTQQPRSWHCEPVPEFCDGLDNDCDFEVDEGCPCENGQTQSCYPGDPTTEGVGICKAGTQSCVNWQWGPCQDYVTPTNESCDGKDNNCDGNFDEGNPGGGNGCMTGQPGICDAGMFVCVGGVLECMPVDQPALEVCDGQDNDCNGTVDDVTGAGDPCDTGLLGVCANGTQTCQGDALVCVQDTQASAEVCGDFLDNDCNGAGDEGCGCAHGLCTVGGPLQSGCDPCVALICAMDAWCCSNEWDSYCVDHVATECGWSC